MKKLMYGFIAILLIITTAIAPPYVYDFYIFLVGGKNHNYEEKIEGQINIRAYNSPKETAVILKEIFQQNSTTKQYVDEVLLVNSELDIHRSFPEANRYTYVYSSIFYHRSFIGSPKHSFGITLIFDENDILQSYKFLPRL